jgi:hypothetical protein
VRSYIRLFAMNAAEDGSAERPPRTQAERLRFVEGLAERALKKAYDVESQTLLFHGTVQRVEGQLQDLTGKEGLLEKILSAVGEEHVSDRGEHLGTGLVGRMMRHEADDAKRFGRYEKWIWMATGAIGAMIFLASGFWWLIGDKLAHVLK